MSRLRIILVALLVGWIGFIFAAFYVVQKPLALQIGSGLLSVLWTLTLAALLLVDAAIMGGALLRKFFPLLDNGERLFLGTGLGLGIFGIIGFGLAAAGAAKPVVLLTLLIVIPLLGIWRGWWRQVEEDAKSVGQVLRSSTERGVKWIPWLAGIALFLSFILAFAPPADSFDALLYHLAVPALWLKDGGLAVGKILPVYWYPGLVEGAYVWGLALWSEATAPLLHLAWGILTVGLIWWWARKVWGNSTAWRSVAVAISMPSLALLAAWAYTDLALAFYSAAALYLLWRYRDSKEKRLLILNGILCGLAMGVKYTSFILPIMVVGWLAWIYRRRLIEWFLPTVQFSVAALLVASPWYIRNWIWMGNPFYPYVFGGKLWDSFLAIRCAQAGTGIGLNLPALFLLPFNVTLGQYDMTYADGRIGPLWLILLPACLWILWHYRKETARQAIIIPAIFGLISFGFWTLGVINTAGLWQSRMLFPSLLCLTPLATLGWEALTRLDTKRFRISFIFNALVILSIAINLLDFGLFVLVRSPMSVALGITDRQSYFERFQPSYADALALVDETPPGSQVLLLFEPRSYGMEREVHSDPFNANLAHDLYLHQTPENVLQTWQAQGYTYVLYQRVGDYLLEYPDKSQRLFSMLTVVEETENTILYQIPTTK
jgi:hypothetical protein